MTMFPTQQNQNPLSMLSNLGQNPLFARAQQMAKGKSSSELEQVAKNLCKEKGIDFDQAVQQFKQVESLFNK